MSVSLLRIRIARRSGGTLRLTIGAFVLAASPALAQVDARIVENPPEATLLTAPEEPTVAQPHARFDATRKAAPTERGIGGEVFYDLAIRYQDGTIFNPSTGTDDPVRLRSYVGAATGGSPQFAAPTVRILPGETFRLTLRNELPADDPTCPGAGGVNVPHCFNRTNMHTHGLHISPTGNSDNVLVSVSPGVSFQYEYNIPPDHPAGTFWYHSHLHGSTALQVSSGMAGALIIEGGRVPALAPDGGYVTGDVDVLLRKPGGEPFRDRVMLFQQIAYACRDGAGAIKTAATGAWYCDAGDVGEVEGYDQLTPASWSASGRFTSINGEVMPTLARAVAGEVERWRLIHGGVRDSIKLRFRKMEPAGKTVAAARLATADARQAFVDQRCTGAPLPALGLAADGLTRGALNERSDTILQPGYREDLLVRFPEPGVYCVINGELQTDQAVNNEPHGRELLGYVRVDEGTARPSAGDSILGALIASAEANLPDDVGARVVADLRDGMRLAAFVRHPDVAAEEVTGRQTLGFRIFNGSLPPAPPAFRFEIGELGRDLAGNLALMNSAPYDPVRMDRTLVLGAVDEWTMTSFAANHPFHIHVNPFQIVEVLDPTGADVSGPGNPNVSQYANLKGVWKDTLMVEQGHVIKVRTRYERYIGDFVLHCHILDHEDQGMMQNVRIAIPDGTGGAAVAHH